MLFCPPLKDLPIKETSDGVILYIKVTPNAAKSKVGGIKVGPLHPFLKIFIKEQAIDGKANKATIDFLHKLFKHSKKPHPPVGWSNV